MGNDGRSRGSLRRGGPPRNMAWGLTSYRPRRDARNPACPPPRNRAGRVQAPAQVDAILDKMVDRLWDRADWYWHEGRYEERVAVDRLIIRMDSGFIEPYGTAGWLLESLGRNQEALALYRQAVAAVPDRWETHQDLGMYYYQQKDNPTAPKEFHTRTHQPAAPPSAHNI